MIVIFSTLVRFLPVIGYSPEPIAYSGGSTYGINYALDTGHFLFPGEAESQAKQNIFVASLVENAEHPIFPILQISVIIVAGLEHGTWQSEIALSLLFTLPILFIVYSILNFISKKRDNKRFNDYLPIIYLGIGLLYSQIGSIVLITQRGSDGWIFFLYPIYFLLFRKEKTIRFWIISLLFLALLPATYFTGASFALLWFSIILLTYRRGRENNIIVWRMFLLFGLFYISYSIFISLGRTHVLLDVWHNLIASLGLGFTNFVPSNVLPAQYIAYGTSLTSKIENLVSAVFVAIPVVFFLIYSIRKRVDHFRGDTTVLAGIITLPITAFLLFIWLGTLGIGRIAEYGAVISMICIACLLPTMKEKKKKFIALIAVLAILSTTIVYVTDENIPGAHITTTEASAAKWLMSTSDNGKIIFTDNRLTAVFVASGFLKVTGLYEGDNTNITIDELNAIYYGDNSSQSILLLSQMGCNYLFFSEGMTNEVPSIYGFNYHFRPAPLNFLDKYKSNTDFNTVYDNGKITIFTLN
jgi:hypothetical protein